MGTRKPRVVGYVRVSTADQGDSGAGLAAQEEAIRREVKYRDWRLLRIYKDVASAKSRDKRPELAEAMTALATGGADTLIVSKLDRLSRSVVDFGSIMEEARTGRWNLVVIDLGIDLATPAGEMVATIMASLAQWERRMISQRTRDALAQKRDAGVKLGRRLTLDPDTEGMIVALRKRGLGYRAIAKHLQDAGIPTSQGAATWHASSVQKILTRLEAA